MLRKKGTLGARLGDVFLSKFVMPGPEMDLVASKAQIHISPRGSPSPTPPYAHSSRMRRASWMLFGMTRSAWIAHRWCPRTIRPGTLHWLPAWNFGQRSVLKNLRNYRHQALERQLTKTCGFLAELPLPVGIDAAYSLHWSRVHFCGRPLWQAAYGRHFSDGFTIEWWLSPAAKKNMYLQSQNWGLLLQRRISDTINWKEN